MSATITLLKAVCGNLQSLEKFKHGAREIKLLGLLLYVFRREFVGDHELRQVSNNLGGGCDLDDISKKIIRLLVGFLGFEPLQTEPQLFGLEYQIRELTTRDLVLVDLCKRVSCVALGSCRLTWIWA